MNSSVERNLSFCGSTYIVPFFVYFFNVSFYGIPGIYYACNFLPCPIFAPRSYRRGKLSFQNNFSLLVLLQQYNFSLSVQFGFRYIETFFILSKISTYILL